MKRSPRRTSPLYLLYCSPLYEVPLKILNVYILATVLFNLLQPIALAQEQMAHKTYNTTISINIHNKLNSDNLENNIISYEFNYENLRKKTNLNTEINNIEIRTITEKPKTLTYQKLLSRSRRKNPILRFKNRNKNVTKNIYSTTEYNEYNTKNNEILFNEASTMANSDEKHIKIHLIDKTPPIEEYKDLLNSKEKLKVDESIIRKIFHDYNATVSRVSKTNNDILEPSHNFTKHLNDYEFNSTKMDTYDIFEADTPDNTIREDSDEVLNNKSLSQSTTNDLKVSRVPSFNKNEASTTRRPDFEEGKYLCKKSFTC